MAASTDTINGNPITHTSFFTFNDNSTATVADAWLVHDTANSYYNGDYTLNAETLFLPDLRGFGTLPELAISESLDATLLVARFGQIAVGRDAIEAVRFLVDRGASFVPDKLGRLPTVIAAECEVSEELCDFIVEAEAAAAAEATAGGV